MLMGVGVVLTIIGVIISGVNVAKFINISQDISSWYYQQSELESCKIFLIVSIAIMIIGVVASLASDNKNK